jgi:nucleoside-diphosphate-sugar epimerase
MKILITGGNGYIAKSIYSSLSSKYDITAITRQDFDLTCWVSTYKFFYDKTFDVVIHTATSGGSRLKEETDLVIRENLLMYRNLLNHQDKFTKFINFGSGAELGNPTTPYGISKQMIASSMFSKPNFLNLRIFAVFDNNELNTRFIKSNIQRYINREDIVIYQDKKMDFFYMKDLISLIKWLINQREEEFPIQEINCSYLEKYTLTQIAKIINSLDNHKVEIQIEDEIEGKPYCGIHPVMPFDLIGLEQGIKETYNILKNVPIN